MRYLSSLTFLLFVVAALVSCKKTVIDPNPVNPFAQKSDTTGKVETDTVNSASIVGLHKKIFFPKCANPGCHDGHFEPDFRTIESAYNSMVWNPVIKNTTDSAFQFKVYPYNAAKSWLHERVITGDLTLGKMPLYAPALTTEEVNNIKTWINNGAKDMFGQSPQYPNSEPKVIGYIATNSNFTARYDTNRVGGVYYNSFIAPANSTVYLFVAVNDDSTLVKNLINNKIRFSTNENDFSSPLKTLSGTYISGGGSEGWLFNFATSTVPANTTIYMRYFTRDEDHAVDTQLPTDNLIHEYKTYWSFIVQ